MVQLLCLVFSVANDVEDVVSTSKWSLNPAFSHFCSFTCIRNRGFPLLCLSKSHFSFKASLQWLIFHEEFPNCISCLNSCFPWAPRPYQLHTVSHSPSAIHQLPFVLLCCPLVVFKWRHFHQLLTQVWVTSLTETWSSREAHLGIFGIIGID